MENDVIKVFIVDDHPVVRSGLQMMLNAEEKFHVMGTADSAFDAFSQLSCLCPDVILMDMRMPQIEGDEAIRHIRKLNPLVRILVLTNYEEEEYIGRALQSGATGYLLKNSSQEHILGAIKTVYSGQRCIPARLAKRLLDTYGPAELSQREIEVLRQVARGLSNRKVAETLFISEKTVRNHVASCLLKLNVNDRTGAVTTALKRGLIRLDA